MPNPHETFRTRPPSRVIEDIVNPLDIKSPDLSLHERELLEKPVLGKDSHGEALFRRFAGSIKINQDPRGINVLRMVIMPVGMSPAEIKITREELVLDQNIPIVFNDKFTGHELELYHTQVHGVYSMVLSDRHEMPASPQQEPFSWEEPSITKLREEMEIGSSVSIRQASGYRRRALFLQAIINGALVRSEITERAEIGFAEICDQLKWSPAV